MSQNGTTIYNYYGLGALSTSANFILMKSVRNIIQLRRKLSWLSKFRTEYSKKTKLVTKKDDQICHVDKTKPVHKDSGSGDYLKFIEIARASI